MKVKIDDGGYMPKRAHSTDAGLDLYTPELIVVPAHGACVVDTRVHLAIPAGWFGKIESKSGLMFRNGIVVPGGVVDSGYTGSIIVKLENHTMAPYKFERGDKIAQIIILPCLLDELHQVPDLDATDRGDAGFGSTGR
ncbi:MAG: dUTP diphosphatase [Lactimicrobium sp.]|uniref:dUTP diphosphatase n=1 Tax=Lactimicrobium sp. TaxID=2563780 RepID=UPI002F3510DC